MKTKITKTNFLKCASFAIIMFGVTTVNAQKILGDVTKAGNAALGGAVRVVDNKGTVKYLQSKNGITMLTNTTTDVTTTTWQLGGTLTDNTYIDATGAAFALDGIELATAATASTNATDKSLHGTGTGWTLLVRDEATGATKKLLAKDLLQAGQQVFTATIGQTAYALTGSPVLPAIEKVSVYRNGAKLLAGTDYTVAASTVTLVPVAATPTSSDDWAVYAGDKIEVHFVK
jgi:hypothetical protein